MISKMERMCRPSCEAFCKKQRSAATYFKNVDPASSSLAESDSRAFTSKTWRSKEALSTSLSLSYPQHSLPDVLPLLGSSALGFQLLHPHPTQAPFELVGKPALPRIRICKLTQDTQVSCNWTWLSNVSSSNLSRVQAFLLFGFLSALNIKKKLEFATCSSCSTLRVVAEFLAGKWVLVHN